MEPRIPNEPEGGASAAFGELLRIQSEFQTRLAEEALKYLHRLQGTAMPAAPGTVMRPGEGSGLQASGRPGEKVELKLEVENRQRVHCSLAPQLTPLVGASGVTWFPAAEPSPLVTLVAPGEVVPLVINLPIPADLPAGTYRGALLLQGFRSGAVAVSVVVEDGDDSKARPSAKEASDTGDLAAKSSNKGSKKGRRTTSKRT
ncbi:MAG: hypothetical protein M3348_06960, partial [Acidobacteriota bacterium]|nr:hypothetical protein [Acidobacteriota bacterium]